MVFDTIVELKTLYYFAYIKGSVLMVGTVLVAKPSFLFPKNSFRSWRDSLMTNETSDWRHDYQNEELFLFSLKSMYYFSTCLYLDEISKLFKLVLKRCLHFNTFLTLDTGVCNINMLIFDSAHTLWL